MLSLMNPWQKLDTQLLFLGLLLPLFLDLCRTTPAPALWTGRNTILHEKSIHSLLIAHFKLRHDITQMYALWDILVVSDHLQSYVSCPLAAHLHQSPCQHLHWWLCLVRLALSHASSAGSRQQLISLYYPYVDTIIHSPPPLIFGSLCHASATPLYYAFTIKLHQIGCHSSSIPHNSLPSLPLPADLCTGSSTSYGPSSPPSNFVTSPLHSIWAATLWNSGSRSLMFPSVPNQCARQVWPAPWKAAALKR